MDNEYEQFLKELNGTSGSSKVEDTSISLGSSDEQILRLTSKVFSSAYDVLQLPADASLKSIKLRFRKLSTMIHPDKCKHAKAHDAFMTLKKAYDDLQRPDYTDELKELFLLAKEAVTRRRDEENKLRVVKGLEKLAEDGVDFDAEVADEVEAIQQRHRDMQEYAEKCRKSNEEVIREGRKRAAKEARAGRKRRKEWDTNLDHRVAGWRSFQHHTAHNHDGVKLFAESLDRK